MTLLFWLAALVALLAGFIISWLWHSRKFQGFVPQSSFDEKEKELDALRSNYAVSVAINGQLENQLHSLAQKLELKSGEASQALLDLEKFKTQFESARLRLDEQKVELEAMKNQMKTEFENLANKILAEKSLQFTETNKTSIDILINPLREKLEGFSKTVQETYEKGTRETSALKQQIEDLGKLNHSMQQEAKNLTQALRGDTKKQGNWGELVLERVLEMGGLRRGYEYDVQVNMTGDEGQRLIPDVVINLPDDKCLVVDAKVSLVAYERAVTTTDDDEAKRSILDHVASVRAHLRGLYGKNYSANFGAKSPDFVLLFIPIEAAFGLALNNDPDLYREALEKNIVIVTPSTLLATVRMVSAIWKQEYQNQNIQKIAQEGEAMILQVEKVFEEMDKVRRNLGIATTSLDDAMKRMSTGKGNILRRAQNMKLLGLKGGLKLPEADDDDRE